MPRPAAKDCRHRLLAHGEAHRITHCTCGHVHVTLGNTTVRLMPDAFQTLADSVAEATEAIAPDPTPLSSTVH